MLRPHPGLSPLSRTETLLTVDVVNRLEARTTATLISWAILSSWSMALCSNGFQAISSILGGQLGTCGSEGGLLVTLVSSDVEELSLELRAESNKHLPLIP